MSTEKLTAKAFIVELEERGKKSKSDNLRFFHGNDGKTKSLGPGFGEIFALAKKYASLPLGEIEKLLESEFYEARMGAVSIMDFKARDKRINSAHRKSLYDLYIGRHDRINNWDLVDRSAPHVVGDTSQTSRVSPCTYLPSRRTPGGEERPL